MRASVAAVKVSVAVARANGAQVRAENAGMRVPVAEVKASVAVARANGAQVRAENAGMPASVAVVKVRASSCPWQRYETL
jgi:hypothetical protein